LGWEFNKNGRLRNSHGTLWQTLGTALLCYGEWGFGPGVYHSYDYPFCYYNIKTNAQNRANLFFGKIILCCKYISTINSNIYLIVPLMYPCEWKLYNEKLVYLSRRCNRRRNFEESLYWFILANKKK